jgi:hypothetical protein
MIAGLALLAPRDLRAEGDTQAAYDSFVTLSKNNAVGVVLAQIKFEQDGSVKQCRVVRSIAPYALEAATAEFIEGHWKNELFAGETRFIPITFDQLPSYSTEWNGDMVTPLDPLAVGDPERKLKLRLTFGTDGWIKKVVIVESSGLDSLDQQTEAWVQVHWHHDGYANQVIDAPFRFEAPVPPPAPVPVAPPVVHQKAPAPPAEPVAIPAMRVQ